MPRPSIGITLVMKVEGNLLKLDAGFYRLTEGSLETR